MLNVPLLQIVTFGMMEFAGHMYPALQFPLHSLDGSALLAPYLPAGHDKHTLNPVVLYLPAEHAVGMSLTDPAMHTYPARH